MANPEELVVGRVRSLHRYPVKSMTGEELEAIAVGGRGLLGDRSIALVDHESGMVASAKNPRRWPNLFGFQAAYVEPPGGGRALPPVRITLPDGTTLTTDDPDAEERLSAALGRRVRLARTPREGATSEGYWPDHEWLAERDQVFEFPLPPGTFFDAASVHLVTTATLDRLSAVAPGSRFETRRFRPNLVIEPADASPGFVEDAWIGRTLEVGEAVLRIDGACPRCVMITLSQGDLPKDPVILRTAVQANRGNVGVYASVVRAGQVRRGDSVRVG